MKLKLLSELFVGYAPGLKFYGDPAGKIKGTSDTSFLKGGKRDRKRFLRAMMPKKKKKKKDKRK